MNGVITPTLSPQLSRLSLLGFGREGSPLYLIPFHRVGSALWVPGLLTPEALLSLRLVRGLQKELLSFSCSEEGLLGLQRTSGPPKCVLYSCSGRV